MVYAPATIARQVIVTAMLSNRVSERRVRILMTNSVCVAVVLAACDTPSTCGDDFVTEVHISEDNHNTVCLVAVSEADCALYPACNSAVQFLKRILYRVPLSI